MMGAEPVQLWLWDGSKDVYPIDPSERNQTIGIEKLQFC